MYRPVQKKQDRSRVNYEETGRYAICISTYHTYV